MDRCMGVTVLIHCSRHGALHQQVAHEAQSKLLQRERVARHRLVAAAAWCLVHGTCNRHASVDLHGIHRWRGGR